MWGCRNTALNSIAPVTRPPSAQAWTVAMSDPCTASPQGVGLCHAAVAGHVLALHMLMQQSLPCKKAALGQPRCCSDVNNWVAGGPRQSCLRPTVAATGRGISAMGAGEDGPCTCRPVNFVVVVLSGQNPACSALPDEDQCNNAAGIPVRASHRAHR